MMTKFRILSSILVHAAFLFLFVGQTFAQSSLGIASISHNAASYPNSQIPAYEKFEITFNVQNMAAINPQLPYDPNPPAGIDPSINEKHRGISVDALFLPPGETDWNKAYQQPAFYYQPMTDAVKTNWMNGQNRGWFLPTGQPVWKVRFAPNQAGTWKYKLKAQDASGSTQSTEQQFVVVASGNKGFVRVSTNDPRYFEYDNGEVFITSGVHTHTPLNDPVIGNDSVFNLLKQNDLKLVRYWISGLYGAAWPQWTSAKGYNGYLPQVGILPTDKVQGIPRLTWLLDQEASGGNIGWFGNCLMPGWEDPEAIKQNTNYKLAITYYGEGIQEPRNASFPKYGVVGKISPDWINCGEGGEDTSNVTTYGLNTPNAWGTVQGTWNSGSYNFVPRIFIALENVRGSGDDFNSRAKAYIRSISLKEDLGGGNLGPELLEEPSLEYELYFPEISMYKMDKLIETAEKNDVYLKLVLNDKNDNIFSFRMFICNTIF